MDFNLFSIWYWLPLGISVIGGVIEFRRCEFNQFRHAFNKAFFLTFRSMVPALNIFSAILYCIRFAAFLWKRMQAAQR